MWCIVHKKTKFYTSILSTRQCKVKLEFDLQHQLFKSLQRKEQESWMRQPSGMECWNRLFTTLCVTNQNAGFITEHKAMQHNPKAYCEMDLYI